MHLLLDENNFFALYKTKDAQEESENSFRKKKCVAYMEFAAALSVQIVANKIVTNYYSRHNVCVRFQSEKEKLVIQMHWQL